MPHDPGRRGGGWMRLRGLLRKEFLQIARDPSSIAIAFVLPVVLLLLFGYGVSLDARHVPIAFVADAPGVQTASLLGAMRHSPYLKPEVMADMATAKTAMLARRVAGIIHLPGNFGDRLLQGRGAPVQLLVDGVDANQARLVEGYVAGTWQTWLAARAIASGRTLQPPVTLVPRIWFNSELRSRNYLVPGLIAVIMTLIGALLTALVMAREWERGTLEALMITPVTVSEILLGKLIPYFVLGMGSMALSVAMAVWLFAVPLRGSLWVLFVVSALFLLAALGMGLLISVITRNQFVAGLVAIITTFLPAFILSGFIFDIGSMPVPLQWLTHLIAARYFVTLLHTLFLAGDIWAVIIPNAVALLLMAWLFIGMSHRYIHKRLD